MTPERKEVDKMVDRIIHLGGTVIKPKKEEYTWFNYTFNGKDFATFTTAEHGSFALSSEYPPQKGEGSGLRVKSLIWNSEEITDNDLMEAPNRKGLDVKGYGSLENFLANNTWYEKDIMTHQAPLDGK